MERLSPWIWESRGGFDEDHREPGWYLTDVAKFKRESTWAFLEVGGDDELIDAMRALNEQAEAFPRLPRPTSPLAPVRRTVSPAHELASRRAI